MAQSTSRDRLVLLKWILFAGNMILWLFGIGVLVFAMWLFFDTGNADAPEKLDEHLRYLSADLSYFYTAVYLLIGAGLITLVIGFLGWLGAYRESPCMLISYASLMGLVFLCHIIGASLGYAYRYEIQQGISTGIQTVVREHYGDLPEYYRDTQTIDYIQQRFNCCGGVEFEDWASSKWKEQPEYQLDEVVPASCCYGSSGIDVICPTYSSIIGGKYPYLHQTGCGTKLKRRFVDYITGITAGGLTVAVFELVAVLMSVSMVRKIYSEDKKIY